jgi:hypothetical protein
MLTMDTMRAFIAAVIGRSACCKPRRGWGLYLAGFEYSAREVLTLPIVLDFFPEKLLYLITCRGERVNDGPEVIEEVRKYACGKLCLSDSMASFDTDNVLDNVAGRPVQQIRFGDFPEFKVSPLMELKQRQIVGFNNLRLTGLIHCPSPGRPSKFLRDVINRLEAVAAVLFLPERISKPG